MRALGVAAVLALLVGGVAGTAIADDHPVPSREAVHAARAAVSDGALGVAAVRARLAVANQRLQESAVAAARASEAYNGARWRAAQAREAAAAAQRRADAANADVEQQRAAYADTVVASYELAPGLTGLGAMVDSDGIDTLMQRSATVENATSALDGNYDRLRAASVVAGVASDQAHRASTAAESAREQAATARRTAQRAADRAASAAASIAAEKTALIARLAELEHVSVALAEQRQSALEARAAAVAAAAAEAEQQAAQQAAPQAVQAAQAAPAAPAQPAPASDPQPDPQSDPAPQPDPAPPAPRGGASAAISFARDQVGEPYRWGAAGPDAWDCSGLTAGAWRAGGTYLPHYSVAQYEQSTAITAAQLRPGDLLFWGSSSNPDSIYHVALYVGGGRMIHAPRTGRPVTEESMYYWTPPNFFARP